MNQCVCVRKVGVSDSYLPESWGKCVEYLKSEWDRKEGRRNKNLKGGKLGQGVEALKKETGIPLQTM